MFLILYNFFNPFLIYDENVRHRAGASSLSTMYIFVMVISWVLSVHPRDER